MTGKFGALEKERNIIYIDLYTLGMFEPAIDNLIKEYYKYKKGEGKNAD